MDTIPLEGPSARPAKGGVEQYSSLYFMECPKIRRE